MIILPRYYDYIADQKGYRIVGHRKTYVNNERLESPTLADRFNSLSSSSDSSANEIDDNPIVEVVTKMPAVKRRLIKRRRRARKTANFFKQNPQNKKRQQNKSRQKINNSDNSDKSNNSNSRLSRRLVVGEGGVADGEEGGSADNGLVPPTQLGKQQLLTKQELNKKFNLRGKNQRQNMLQTL